MTFSAFSSSYSNWQRLYGLCLIVANYYRKSAINLRSFFPFKLKWSIINKLYSKNNLKEKAFWQSVFKINASCQYGWIFTRTKRLLFALPGESPEETLKKDPLIWKRRKGNVFHLHSAEDGIYSSKQEPKFTQFSAHIWRGDTTVSIDTVRAAWHFPTGDGFFFKRIAYFINALLSIA